MSDERNNPSSDDLPAWPDDVPSKDFGDVSQVGKAAEPVTSKSKQKLSHLADATPASFPSELVKVKFLNTDVYEGRYLVRDESNEVYLVPTEKLQWESQWQDIEKRDLEAAERPYDLDNEIQPLFVTPQEVKVALWSMGIITQEDAQKADLRDMIAKLLMKGVLPIKD